MVYQLLSRILPTRRGKFTPKRIALIRPCCIGDVVMATAALSALREAFPDAHISWAVGPWSAPAIAHHPAIDDLVITQADMPLCSPVSFWHFLRQLRASNFDCAVSLVRSPLMSLAVWLAGIPLRAGLDSGGRGFGYNLRVEIDPDVPEHESEIYLKVVNAVASRELRAFANLPVTDAVSTAVRAYLKENNIDSPLIVAHPGGGVNPGARYEAKRFPLPQLAETLNRVAERKGAGVILLGGPGDADLVAEVEARLSVPWVSWVDRLTFQEIGALAAEALVYIGNDTGLTHLAAASGAKTVMLMGPTDPQRYAPYTKDSMVVRIPFNVGSRGVAGADAPRQDWQDIGIHAAVAVERILNFLGD
ncbi:MAG: hypothetical protein OXG78_04635 [Chloroflexi bacterium]|nr:hypothetical protein [Chloroflexota bacterium]